MEKRIVTSALGVHHPSLILKDDVFYFLSYSYILEGLIRTAQGCKKKTSMLWGIRKTMFLRLGLLAKLVEV